MREGRSGGCLRRADPLERRDGRRRSRSRNQRGCYASRDRREKLVVVEPGLQVRAGEFMKKKAHRFFRGAQTHGRPNWQVSRRDDFHAVRSSSPLGSMSEE